MNNLTNVRITINTYYGGEIMGVQNIQIAESISKEQLKALALSVDYEMCDGNSTEGLLSYTNGDKAVDITLYNNTSDVKEEWIRFKSSDDIVQLSIDDDVDYVPDYNDTAIRMYDEGNDDFNAQQFVDHMRSAANAGQEA